ncbi:MAG: hypothetical protein QNL62_08930, partial [Gammaproteobacteria bacterium]|nr:hypothetical protein [Gammaproteobacteria bacterium]
TVDKEEIVEGALGDEDSFNVTITRDFVTDSWVNLELVNQGKTHGMSRLSFVIVAVNIFYGIVVNRTLHRKAHVNSITK